MQVLVLQNASPKMGGYRAGQVLDLSEEKIAEMPGFFRPVGAELETQATRKRAAEQAQVAKTEDRIARKASMARHEADRQAAQADILMKDAALRMQLAEQAKRQAAEASEHAEQLAAASAPAPVDLPPARTDSASTPPHKRNRTH